MNYRKISTPKIPSSTLHCSVPFLLLFLFCWENNNIAYYKPVH